METRKILRLYGQYSQALEAVGRVSLREFVLINELGLPRSLLVGGYRDMQREEFSGSLVDFYCYLSFQYLAHLAEAMRIPLEDLLLERAKDYLPDAQNTLRLFLKNPWETDEIRFMKMAKVWFNLLDLEKKPD